MGEQGRLEEGTLPVEIELGRRRTVAFHRLKDLSQSRQTLLGQSDFLERLTYPWIARRHQSQRGSVLELIEIDSGYWSRRASDINPI